ncbi:hypothetical protein NQ318_015197 [Aromia moschata]|uniref:Aromatic-L-amino-acid decarboxylase n=1 Tax=Aromia moschata TaxID=1265417 RepID=A0AAV8XL98_9CUCU|nr:hypothetical protein NQ318_015197 [Aromia moschata]
MNTDQFRQFGKAAVDYIADYFDSIKNRPVFHSVHPGYLQELIPAEPPRRGDLWKDVLQDVDRVIMPGITHWHSPNFHAYFSAANSFPAIVGEMMGAGFTSIGINWMASPAYTELEVAMMNWLGKLLHLPEHFLNCSDGPGGGVIQAYKTYFQGSASETTLLCLLAAKEKKVRDLKALNPDLNDTEIKTKLVAYSSDQSNSSVERAGLLGSVPMRLIPADEDGKFPANKLLEAMRKDRAQGLIPCYVVACLGTTPTCAFDDLTELGPICNQENVWLHVDAAYAGAAFSCPEYRYLMEGVEYADSFNFSPHKWMLVNFDCSAMWVRNARFLTDAFQVDRIYLKSKQLTSIPEYRHWRIPLGGKFRALKLWFVLRIYGVEGIQNYIRHQVALAKYFEQLVVDDSRFELCCSNMGLVCFQLRGDNELTEILFEKIIENRNIFVLSGYFNGKYVIRFSICSQLTERCDIDNAWQEIVSQAKFVLRHHGGLR